MSLSSLIEDIAQGINLSNAWIDDLQSAVNELPVQDDIVNIELATKLWNFTTRLTVGKDVACDLLAIARVRHQASLIVLKSGNSNLALTMALKSAITWARAGEMSESYKTLNEVEKKVSSERILEVLSVKAQLACFDGDLENAEKILFSISEQSQETAAMTCWEIATNFYKQEKVTNTRYAVERAIKYGKGLLPNVKISRMYRLLTTCYFEEEADVSACITAARLATQLDPCAESQLLLIKCLAVADSLDLLAQQLEEIKVSLEPWFSEALDIVLEYARPDSAGQILSRYSNFTSGNTQLLLLKSQLSPEHMDSIENIVKTLDLLRSSSSNNEDASEHAVRARDLLWQAGVTLWDKCEYRTAEQLYTLCLDLSPAAEDREKLLRNIATSQIAAGNLSDAETTLAQLQSGDSILPVLLFQIALLKGDEGKALELIGSVKEEKHLQTAAMLAFKTNREAVAKQSLQRAVQVSKDPQFILPAARCLLRLSKTPEEEVKLFELILTVRTDHMSAAELGYLADVAWNCSIKAKTNLELMRKLLGHCITLVTRMKSPLTPQYHDRLRNCHLLITAACLQSTENSTDTALISGYLEDAMEHIAHFKRLGNENLDQTTTLMLLLYELECAVKLDLPEARSLLNCVSNLPYATPKTLDRVVKICVLGKDPSLSQNAIRYAIEKHLQANEPDWKSVSQLFVRLAKNTPNFHQVFKLWAKYVSKFPEDEAAWMVCEAWNRGVSRDDVTQTGNDVTVTRELCELALEVTQHLPNYKDVYQKHMRPIMEQYQLEQTSGC